MSFRVFVILDCSYVYYFFKAYAFTFHKPVNRINITTEWPTSRHCHIFNYKVEIFNRRWYLSYLPLRVCSTDYQKNIRHFGFVEKQINMYFFDVRLWCGISRWFFYAPTWKSKSLATSYLKSIPTSVCK